jgi:hypothetical protein
MEIYKIINLIHGLFVFWLFISVFINNYQNKKLVLSVLILILIQFMTNYGRCGLTEIEYLFKREKYKEGFIYRIVKPIITIPEDYFYKYIHILHILWIIILWNQINNKYV